MLRKTIVLSSYAVAATVALFAILLSGCERQGSVALEEVYPVDGNAFMHDPAFRAKLEVQRAGRDGIALERRRLNAAMSELVKKFSDDRVAAEASPEGRELLARMHANDEQIISNRAETARLTRERMQRAVEDSARIRRGEAKAIDISKQK